MHVPSVIGGPVRGTLFAVAVPTLSAPAMATNAAATPIFVRCISTLLSIAAAGWRASLPPSYHRALRPFSAAKKGGTLRPHGHSGARSAGGLARRPDRGVARLEAAGAPRAPHPPRER